MSVTLSVSAGPHAGKEFTFDGHDTFLVGRSKDAHLQLSYDDPYFSRRHFLVELNPPRCRVIDLNSRNGTCVNGKRVEAAELSDGDEVRAGHTIFRVQIPPPDPDKQSTLNLPAEELAAEPPWGDERASTRPATIDGPIPGYQLLGEVGRGAICIVYRATRLADGSTVAVKLITPAPGVSHRQIEKFLREARVLSALEHPNVVRFYDGGEAGPIVYLVMEFVDGQDVARRVWERGPLPVATAVRITCSVLAALGYAHERGYVHRDVKPGNILLGGSKPKRVPKLADFGLAKAYDDCRLSGLTFQGEIGGTPAYMAPEQVTHFRQVRPAADQYSAAATLYNLLTGQHPHVLGKQDVTRQLAKIITEPPVPITDWRSGLPSGLPTVIHRALAREPEDRFSDVHAFRDALLPFAT